MFGRTVMALLVTALVVCCFVLSFYRATDAAPPAARSPFANAVEQRMEMISQLQGIHLLLKEQNQLLREQNELLRSGKTKLVPGKPDQE